MTHIISTISLALVFLGLLMLRRKDYRTHAALMATAFAIDFSLVLYIEIMRGAVEQAMRVPPPLLLFHIIISTLALLLHAVQLVLGALLLKGKLTYRGWHRWLGIAYLVLRLGNYVTSFII